MKKKTKIWIWSGFGVVSAAIVVIPLAIYLSHRNQVGYYLSTNDLYYGSDDLDDTMYVTCLNSNKHSGIEVSIAGDKTNIEELGWNKNKYGIRIINAPAATENILINVTKNGTPVIQDEKVYLHDEDDKIVALQTSARIDTLSMQISAKNSHSGGLIPQGVSGTAFVAKHLEAGDPEYDVGGGDYQYYLITNWHVVEMMQKIKSANYYYNWTDTPNHDLKPISDFKLLEHGSYESVNNNIGFDSYLCYANFGLSDTGKFSNVNSICDANGYPFQLSNKSNASEEEQLFIGGYPVNQSSRDTHYTFLTCRPDFSQGYKERIHDKPKEMVTMSHYLEEKKYWTIGNDVIMKPTVCDKLSGGASGSMVMTWEGGVPTLVGIYWGGRTVDKTDAYCGNIETYYAPAAEDQSFNFLEYNVNSMFPTDNTYTNYYLDIPTAS